MFGPEALNKEWDRLELEDKTGKERRGGVNMHGLEEVSRERIEKRSTLWSPTQVCFPIMLYMQPSGL